MVADCARDTSLGVLPKLAVPMAVRLSRNRSQTHRSHSYQTCPVGYPVRLAAIKSNAWSVAKTQTQPQSHSDSQKSLLPNATSEVNRAGKRVAPSLLDTLCVNLAASKSNAQIV